ncbi:PREDICTED: uncharacterized protein LOC104800434 [Tarenaya hassleriana]|uniref:uncharacterized protein LOC104800434 n=1 Tax=Tarenaya hassleriana TaxID=28532 RepID=UPI00053C39E3|nr:PREDICTED: uncharacterized protein LOC104800434 [Tarenaya hassleriana]XP_010521529.1 PREDICTED: uncharacterized protein LOC104800434 [Tarenaya hassleriana]XP_010521530.1 PREDICTED: uncharacterized protein LOC104800434 [Tarenaya hassleriana]XP_010521531.1 PREDICTED: uncharacterized protein LOC104800434 [Tarenaya hassleriana]XP_019056611.1 PREDICTED: uncharacterized protein LOC104800434 [Tarenaya hassleriana]
MADSSPDSSDKSHLVGLRRISTSLFSIPGFFVGFGSKGTSEPDVGKSPTSSLDFGVFANFGGLFSPRSPACSSPRNSQKNKWGCEKVGLSILNSLGKDSGQGNEGNNTDSFRKENIVVTPRIKIDIRKTAKLSCEVMDPSAKSNSLPKNYVATSLCESADFQSQSSDLDAAFRDERAPEEYSSLMKPSSSPMNITSSRLYSRSLSAREMTLSEDYTCIISHGPNPKTTHIFGECILDCDPKELAGFDTAGEAGNLKEDPEPPNHHLSDSSSHLKEGPEAPNHHLSDSSSHICLCKEEAGDGESIRINRLGNSQTGDYIDALEEDVWPGSSYHEDVFSLGNAS